MSLFFLLTSFHRKRVHFQKWVTSFPSTRVLFRFDLFYFLIWELTFSLLSQEKSNSNYNWHSLGFLALFEYISPSTLQRLVVGKEGVQSDEEEQDFYIGRDPFLSLSFSHSLSILTGRLKQEEEEEKQTGLLTHSLCSWLQNSRNETKRNRNARVLNQQFSSWHTMMMEHTVCLLSVLMLTKHLSFSLVQSVYLDFVETKVA